jgi:hypothetical protein
LDDNVSIFRLTLKKGNLIDSFVWFLKYGLIRKSDRTETNSLVMAPVSSTKNNNRAIECNRWSKMVIAVKQKIGRQYLMH